MKPFNKGFTEAVIYNFKRALMPIEKEPDWIPASCRTAINPPTSTQFPSNHRTAACLSPAVTTAHSKQEPWRPYGHVFPDLRQLPHQLLCSPWLGYVLVCLKLLGVFTGWNSSAAPACQLCSDAIVNPTNVWEERNLIAEGRENLRGTKQKHKRNMSCQGCPTSQGQSWKQNWFPKSGFIQCFPTHTAPEWVLAPSLSPSYSCANGTLVQNSISMLDSQDLQHFLIL